MCSQFLSLKNFVAGAVPTAQPAALPPRGNVPPPQALRALRNAEAADPVGRVCGWPLPGEDRPCGRLTPCFCRHCRKLAWLPGLDEDGVDVALLALQPVARAPASSRGPRTASRARCRARYRYRLVVTMSPSR